jgi:hypothetical protein
MNSHKNFENYVINVVANDVQTWNEENPDCKFDFGMLMVTSRYKSEKRYCKYDSVQEGVADWLQGLAMSFEFSNYNIIQKGKEFGYDLDTTYKQNRFVSRWFMSVANILIKLADKSGMSFN